MFDILKVKKVEESVVTLDNPAAILLATQLRLSMPVVGDTVKVSEKSVFDAGLVGTIIDMENLVIIESDGTTITVEHDQVERVLTLSDLMNSEYDIALESVYTSILQSLSDAGVDTDVINEDVFKSIQDILAGNTYVELMKEDVGVLVAKELMTRFPRMHVGVVELPKKYDLINASLNGE